MYKIDFNEPIHIHFIGIGGISMSGLAEILLKEGFIISGSDNKESALTDHLEKLGAKVFYGQKASNIISGIDVVVYTAAIHPDNEEFAEAVKQNLPMLTRAELLGQLMTNYDVPIAISGTHGKTTTTSMLSHILLAGEMDPTISVGGILKAIGGNIRVGNSEYFVTEACEYTNSFLHFFPKIGVILNIDEDHLDFFKDLADIEHSFHDFAALVPQRGYIIANADDEGAREAVKGLSHPVFTFSVRDRGADCYADNVSFFDGYGDFDVVINGVTYAHVSLHVPGAHNISNALAAASAAYVLGIPGEAVTAGLASFTGAGRRFEHKGTFHGAEVYDDYAHHPDEVQALLNAVRPLPHQRLILAFQPHTYTRTAALFDDFVNVLRQADRVVLAEIYAARETNELGISSRDLAAQIPHSVYCPTLEQVADELEKLAQPGDMIITVGAGDIYRAGEMLLKRGDAQ